MSLNNLPIEIVEYMLTKLNKIVDVVYFYQGAVRFPEVLDMPFPELLVLFNSIPRIVKNHG